MTEKDAFITNKNAYSPKHNSSGLGHIIIPDGGVMFTTTTNATADTFTGDGTNPTTGGIHLQHHHTVVNLKCGGSKNSKQLNSKPLNAFIG